MNDPANPSPQVIDKTLNPTFVNVVGTVIMVIILVIVVGIYSALWHVSPFAGFALFKGDQVNVNLLWLVPIFIVSTVIHELLHALGYVLCGAKRSEVAFGFHWKALMPYAHCKIPLSVSAYRFSGALPGIVQGVIPLAAGTALGVDWLTLYGAIMLCGAVGDMLILWLTLSVPQDAQILDHPSKPGFVVMQ